MTGERGPTVRAEPRPCVACGALIAPGQLFTVQGPFHVYCAPPARLDVARMQQAARQR